MKLKVKRIIGLLIVLLIIFSVNVGAELEYQQRLDDLAHEHHIRIIHGAFMPGEYIQQRYYFEYGYHSQNKERLALISQRLEGVLAKYPGRFLSRGNLRGIVLVQNLAKDSGRNQNFAIDRENNYLYIDLDLGNPDLSESFVSAIIHHQLFTTIVYANYERYDLGEWNRLNIAGFSYGDPYPGSGKGFIDWPSVMSIEDDMADIFVHLVIDDKYQGIRETLASDRMLLNKFAYLNNFINSIDPRFETTFGSEYRVRQPEREFVEESEREFVEIEGSHSTRIGLVREVVRVPDAMYDETEVDRMIRRVANIDLYLLEQIKAKESEIIFTHQRIVDLPEYQHLQGVRTREGSDRIWDNVDGIGGPSAAVARIASTNHGTVNLELHEVGHLVDYGVFDILSNSDEFQKIWSQEAAIMFDNNSYFVNYSEEHFAESFAYYYLNDNTRSQLRTRAPLTYQFFRNNFRLSLEELSRVRVEKALFSMDLHDVVNNSNYATIDANLMDRLGLELGDEIIVRAKDNLEESTSYTIVKVLDEGEDIIRMGLNGRRRLNQSDPFKGYVSGVKK